MIDPNALQAIKSHANLLAAGSHQAIPVADLESILKAIPGLASELERLQAEATIVVEVDPDPVLVTSTTSIPPRDLKRR